LLKFSFLLLLSFFGVYLQLKLVHLFNLIKFELLHDLIQLLKQIILGSILFI